MPQWYEIAFDMQRRSYLSAIGAATAGLLAGCTDRSSSGDGNSGNDKTTTTKGTVGGSGTQTLAMGELNPITGAASFYGKPMDAGLQVGLADAGEFEVNGQTYEWKLNRNSDECKNQKGINIVRRLVQEHNIDFVMGSLCSNVSKATASLIQDSDATQIINGSYTYSITYNNNQIFRATYTSLQQEPGIMRLVSKNDYSKVGYLLDKKNPGFVEQAKRLKPKIEDQGRQMEIVQYTRGQNDFSTQIQKLKRANVEIIFIGGYVPDIYSAIEQAYNLGLNVPKVDLGQGSESVVKDTVSNPDSLNKAKLLSAPTTPGLVAVDRGPAKKFKQKANEQFPDVTMNLLGGGNYDSVFFLIRAMQRAGSVEDNEAIRQELLKLTTDDVENNLDIPVGGLVQPYLPMEDGTILDDTGQAWFETFVFDWDGYKQKFDQRLKPDTYPTYPEES